MPMDLSQPGASAELVAALDERGRRRRRAREQRGLLDLRGVLARRPATQSGMLQVNVVALTELSRLIVPGMVERGRGRVLQPRLRRLVRPGADDRGLRRDEGLRAVALARDGRGAARAPASPSRACARGRPRPASRTGPRCSDSALIRGKKPAGRARGRRGGLRRDEGRQALRGHRRHQQGVRVRVAVPAAHDDRAHRRAFAAPRLTERGRGDDAQGVQGVRPQGQPDRDRGRADPGARVLRRRDLVRRRHHHPDHRGRRRSAELRRIAGRSTSAMREIRYGAFLTRWS